MSKNNHHGGKSGRDDHDDYGSGHKGKFQLLVGTNGNEVLAGGSRNDLIIALAGDDKLLGGAGNDILIGDGGIGGKHWGWNQCHWWKPKGQGDDYLDGGAGNDLVLAGKGDDVANYTLSENSRAHDVYDGGKGFDTLQLTLTHAELQLASVQKDIAAFEAFLACKADPHSDSGRTFHFQSFDLDARNFEDLKIVLLNAPPVAKNDAYTLDEDTALVVLGPGILGNDSDLEGSPLSVALVTGPAHGTLALGADGSFTYTPNLNFNGTDAFSYKVNDGDLDSNIAAVTLQVAPENDAPVADDEVYSVHAGQTLSVPAAQGLLIGDTDADSDPLSVTQANVTGLQGSLAPSADGSFQFTPTSGFSGTTSFTYTVGDGFGGFDQGSVTINVTNEAPVADDEHYTMRPGQTLSVPAAEGLLVGDTDADGDALNVTQANVTGLQGSLASSADGSFQFTPTSGFSGTTSFTYTVGDGLGGIDTATVSIDVVNSVPVADDEVYSVHAGQTLSVPAAQGLLIGDTDADSDPLSVTQANVTGLQGSLAPSADGSFQFTPTSGFSGTTSFTYTVGDGFGGFDQGSVTINVTNVAPVATDDTIGGSGGGAIRVAVIGGSASTYLAVAVQLNDEVNPAFDLDAVAIDIAAWTTEAQWTAVLANYDVVVLGGSGGGNDYGDSPVFAALGDFVDAGGGVVTTGWFAQVMAGMSGTTLSDADYITPITGSQYAYAANLSTITIANADHPIAGGTESYTVQALYHELAPAIEGSATPLATGTATFGDTLTAIAYDEVGAGLTVYLGSLHFASADFSPEFIRAGAADQILERAVAWAAGAPASGAATDEDTILVIDDAQLLANDTDVDGDALSIASVAATSTLGASITIDDATGKVVYDPTVALQYLSAGEIKTDNFEYTISDGNGGFDTAKVSLTVAGMYDAPDAAIEAFSYTVAPDVDLF